MSEGKTDEKAQDTIPTRILILSDTHAGRYSDPWGPSFRLPLPKADVVLHAGDLTMTGHPREIEGALALLKAIDCPTKLVIAGNHDMTLHPEFYLHSEGARRWAAADYHPDHVGAARELMTGERAKAAGVTYLEEGVHHVKLANGALLRLYASPWQPEFLDWAFNYPHSHDRWNPPEDMLPDARPADANTNPQPIPSQGAGGVDVVMTHGPARGHLDACDNGARAGCAHLLAALRRAAPLLHVCGHIHEAWGGEVVTWGRDAAGDCTETAGAGAADQDTRSRHAAYAAAPARGRGQTLLVNAAVLDTRYEPANAAWLVDVGLPRA